MAALHVQRSSFGGCAVDQVARPVFILWILLNYLTAGNSFPHLLQTDVTNNALINGVFGELEPIGFNLPADIIYDQL
jgi:hypothetical protein